MGLNLTALTQWTVESAEKADLIIKSFLSDPSLDYIDKHKVVKGERFKAPIVSTTGTATNAQCTSNDTDTATISQFTMVGNFKNYRNSMCLDQLDTYFTQQWHNGDTLTVLDDWYSKEIALKIIEMAKRYAWLSNTGIATLPADFKEFNGLLQNIDTGSGTIFHTIATGKVLGTSNSTTTEKVTEVIEDLFSKLPEQAVTGQQVVAFVPPSVLQMLRLIIKADNNFHYRIEDLKLNPYVIKYPGIDNLLVVAASGLSNNAVTGQDNTQKDRIVMTPVGNIAIGLDENTIKENTKIFYDELNDKLVLKTKYWLSVGVKFYDFVATSKRS